VISECLTDDNVIKPLLHYVKWLRANEISPLYSDFEGQSPFWEVSIKAKGTLSFGTVKIIYAL